MARHWSVFCRGLTEKQAGALDKMAAAHGLPDGMSILAKLTGCSSSKIGKMDRLSLRPYIDQAFAEYGRDKEPERTPAPKADPLTEAVESGLARINGEAAAEPAWAAPLRVVGGIVGLLRGHADRLEAGEPFGPAALRHLADRLQAEYLTLHQLLHGGPK